MSGYPAACGGEHHFAILNTLGEAQVSEQVVILVDGKTVGTLTVNQDFPEAMLKVTVPKPGTYSYTVEAQAVFNNQGNLFGYQGAGQGNISVQSGKQFRLVGSFSGDTWLVTLQEVENSTASLPLHAS
jgi:hypothetical protein